MPLWTLFAWHAVKQKNQSGIGMSHAKKLKRQQRHLRRQVR
jgi:hypothetical protein